MNFALASTIEHMDKRVIAALELLLLFPAFLFMTALVGRRLPPLHAGRALAAEQIVSWYALRPWTLWVLLIALPLGVLALGWAALQQSWRDLLTSHAPLATRFIAVAMLISGAILAVVAVHMLAN
jgi:hypothetical protein